MPYDESCMETMENMIDEGCEVIICNSFNYGEWIVKTAEKYPNIVFLHASGAEKGDNITTYFGRMYHENNEPRRSVYFRHNYLFQPQNPSTAILLSSSHVLFPIVVAMLQL